MADSSARAGIWALRSSVSEVDIGQYTNKFAIAYIYLASLSDFPKFLVAWSAQACCDRSNPSKGRKEAFFYLDIEFCLGPRGERRGKASAAKPIPYPLRSAQAYCDRSNPGKSRNEECGFNGVYS